MSTTKAKSRKSQGRRWKSHGQGKSQGKSQGKCQNGKCRRKIQFLSRNQKKQKWRFVWRVTLAFDFFVDVVKRQKASSRFFCEWIVYFPDSYHHYIYLTFIRSVWIDSILKNSIIVILLGFGWCSEWWMVRSQKRKLT